MRSQPQIIDDTYTTQELTQGEQYLLKQPLEVDHENIRVPDLTSHSESTIVGHAVERLNRLGIPSDQIIFHIAQRHTNFGEIVALDPSPGTEIGSDQEIRLTVGTWAKDNRHRFSFFASDETQSTERSLDVDQLDVWEMCKSHLVHLFATLDQKADIDGNRLLAIYGHRLLSDQLREDFIRQRESSKGEFPRTTSRLMSDSQREIIIHALMLRSRSPFTMEDFAWLLGRFFRLELSKVQCTQNGSTVRVYLLTDRIDGADFQFEWLRYLFCPLELHMEFEWHPPPPKDPDEQPNDFILDVPFYQLEPHPSKWSRIVELCRRFLKWSGHWLVIALTELAAWVWFAFRAANRWLLRTFSLKQIVAASIVVAAIIGVWVFMNPPGPPLTPWQIKSIGGMPPLTHREIQSIGGMPPHKAIEKGLFNSPYLLVDGTSVRPIRREKAKSYNRIGTASHYMPEETCLTVSGEIFDPEELTAAHETLPIPSTVRVTNLKNNLEAILIINDRGPFCEGRLINVSDAAAHKLGFHYEGTVTVRVEVINPPASHR